METSSRARLYVLAALSAFVGAAFAAYFGVALTIAAMEHHAESADTVLVAFVGVLLVLVAPVLVIFGAIAWSWSKSIRIN